ncbi:acyl-CoA mutase large subunit family protein [Ornithinimicrobium faecis]|uniref:acyl-CoA mutase large subunit family protein n=1 Tax=Ornithinimicrobium faecis TaxID=2934158 RepID=UPI0021176D3C|nr:methylmalonyl-CoA mutase family protein [Ornithinimicrobium sp. HY1745]
MTPHQTSPDVDPVTTSGLPVARVYAPEDGSDDHRPGVYPYTRGNFPGGYRDRLWTFRQYSGFGTAEESNVRYKYLLSQGGTGLSVALDLPTQIGYDSDHPDAAEEVGRVGVAIDSLADMELLFDGIDLGKISTSFTINGTAAILLAMYVAAGEKSGVERSALRGTIQNDILKEYAARGTWVWPPEPSLRLIADTIEFCATDVPRFNAISVAGAHFRDAGATAAQEMAYTLADGIAYCEEVISRGRMTIDQFAPQVSFFFYTHNDFFEEIAKYRAGRRIWARTVKERFEAQNEKSAMFRFGCVCGGASLYAYEAQNNVVRVAYEAMAAALGGVQSMFTAAWDEPFALPTEESTTLALRTQQILAFETGITRTVDPLGGSYFVEALTDAMEEKILGIMNDLEESGGIVGAIESGTLQRAIGDEASDRQRKLESGEEIIVGVNKFVTEDSAPDVEGHDVDEAKIAAQVERLHELRRTRNDSEVRQRLDELQQAVRSEQENLMPYLIEASKAYCTVGEMADVMRAEWGEFQQPKVI